MNPKSFLLKLNGWQRVWVIFSVLCLVAVGVIVVIYFPEGGQYKLPKIEWYQTRQLYDLDYQYQMHRIFMDKVKFIITWFIVWLGTIGVAYVGGIAVAWVIKGFRHDRSESARGHKS